MQLEDPELTPHVSRFWPHCAMIVWGIAFLALCGRTLLMQHDAHSVYPVFTTAAQRWLNGQKLYIRGGTEEFRYSPIIAASFVPFYALPERFGHFLWRSLNFLAFVAGVLYCRRRGIPRNLSDDATGVMFLLLLPLAIGSLNNAQSNPLVIGCLLAAAAAVVDRRWWTCAVVVSLATLFKLYPAALGLLLIALYPKQLGWRLAVCLAIGLLLPFALQRPGYVAHEYGVWFHYLSTEDWQLGPIADWYKDARAVWRVYLEPSSARTYQIVEIASGGCIALLMLNARRAGWRLGKLLAYTLSLACCWMTVLGPATESTTYILIAPAAVWPLMEAAAEPMPLPLRMGFLVAYGLLAASSGLVLLGPGGKIFRDQLQLQPVAGLLLLPLLVIDGLRQSRTPRAVGEQLPAPLPTTLG